MAATTIVSPLPSLPRSARRALLLLAASGLPATLCPPSALAQGSATQDLRLDWIRREGAESCAAGDRIAHDVEGRLGRHVFSNAGSADGLEGWVERVDDVFRVTLRRRASSGSVSGERVLESDDPSCAPLMNAAVLAIAIAIDPDAANGPSPRAAPPNETVVPRAPPARDRAAAETTPARTMNASLGAGMALAFGVLPRTAVGLRISGSIPVSSRVHLFTEATLLPEVEADDAHFRFDWYAAAAGACYSFVASRQLTFDACASVLVGAIHVGVHDRTTVSSGAMVFPAVALGPRASWRVAGPLSIATAFDVIAPFTRHKFLYNTTSIPGDDRTLATPRDLTVFDQPVLGVVASIGLRLETP